MKSIWLSLCSSLKVLCSTFWNSLIQTFPQNTNSLLNPPACLHACLRVSLKLRQGQRGSVIRHYFPRQRQRGECMFLISSRVPFCSSVGAQRLQARLLRASPSLLLRRRLRARAGEVEHVLHQDTPECTRSKSKGCIIKMCTDITSRSICPSVRRWNKDQATCLHDGVDVGRSQLVFVQQTMICRSITSQGCVQMLMEGGIFRLGKIYFLFYSDRQTTSANTGHAPASITVTKSFAFPSNLPW